MRVSIHRVVVAGMMIAATPAAALDVSVIDVVAEYSLPVNLLGDEIPFGGISGLAFDPACGLLYAVSDDRGHFAPPRIHVLRPDPVVSSVRPLETITLLNTDGEPFAPRELDAEAVALAPDGTLWVATEGVSHRRIPPRIMAFRLDGALLHELEIPSAYHPTQAGRGVRSNHGFEGLGITPDGSRIVAAIESPLAQDGPECTLETGCRIRLVVFDVATRRAISERAYDVEPIPDAPEPSGASRSTGVSEILALDERRLLVVERSFAAGVGNRVRLFEIEMTTGDELLGAAALPESTEPVSKHLIADLAALGVDPENLEAMTFGPRLADGRATLVLAADNNFQPAVQRNQMLVLAVDGLASSPADRIPISIVGIQGRDHVSPLVGRCVAEVDGVVTAVLGQRSGQAFWIQQTTSDDNSATSDGLFVTALGGLPAVDVGDRVVLSGRVEEPRWGMELSVTRLVADTLDIADRGVELPPPAIMGRGGRRIPSPMIDDDGLSRFEPETDAIDFYESLEGMRVRVEAPVAVGPMSKHGEFVVLGDAGADSAPRSGRGGVVLRPDTAHPERILIDDRLVPAPPSVAVGDRLVGPIDGVLHYSYGSFKLLNTEPLAVDERQPASPEPASLVADARHVTVATYNVENLSVSADEAEVAAIAETIVDLLRSPTVLAVQEIQDDSGSADDGTVEAEATLGRLVEAVTTAGGPAYAWTQIDPENNADGGRPGANIRVVLLFDPERARLVAGPGRIGVGDPAFADSRKPLTAELEVDGQSLRFVVCHLRSKGGDDPLFGRRQPPVRSSELQRIPQAEIIRNSVDAWLASNTDAGIVILGDLNDFEFSRAVGVLAAAPMVNLMQSLPVAERSTYNYLGNSQILDHIIVSPALADGAEIEVVQVNADEPVDRRASDHDPVIARFTFKAGARSAVP
jgi:hypothetical protein